MDKYFRYEDVKEYICSFYLGNECDCDNSNGCKKLDKLPFADVAPVRHGRWLIKTVRGDKRTVCSECLSETGTCYEENYCPNCGAKMDKEAEDG